ncbi:hypothetical protein HMI54_001229 [Coelomomyces lativittatus]|nr:hypothetical protein HMI54_001229 [Coelomomyces lativittatus]
MIHPANTTSTTLLPTNPKAPEVYSKSISNPTANTSQASTTSIYTQDIETAIGVIRESFVHLVRSGLIIAI